VRRAIRGWLRALSCFGGLVIGNHCLVAAAPLHLDCNNPQSDIELAIPVSGAGADMEISIDAGTAEHAVFVGEERGADWEWRLADESNFRDVDSRPPRYGIFAQDIHGSQHIQVRPRPAMARVARARLHLYCEADPEIQALPACLAQLQQPMSNAERGWCAALHTHAAATAAAHAGDSATALLRYRDAARAWQARNDPLREGAALLGSTEVLFRLGRVEGAITEAQRSADLSESAGNKYFALRASSEVCLSLRELGRRASAHACLEVLPAAFEGLGEAAEAANAYFNLGSMADEDGDSVAAARLLDRSRALDLRGTTPDVVGRIDVLRAALDGAAGHLSLALGDLDRAAVVFERGGNARWLADVDVRMARLYAQLGAWEESRVFANDALDRLPEAQAPTRRAEAYRAMAYADAALQRPTAARANFVEARRILSQFKVPLGVLAIDLDAALLLDDDAALAQAVQTNASELETSPRLRTRLALARASHALRDGQTQTAQALLKDVRDADLDLSEFLVLRTLQARTLARLGRADVAFRLLDNEIARLRVYALAGSAAALRDLAGQRLLELRRAWIDLYLDAPIQMRPGSAAVWTLLLATQPAGLIGGADARQPSEPGTAAQVDRTLARVLLEPQAELDSAKAALPQRALVHYYASTRSATIAARSRSLDEARADLPAGTRLLAFGFGSRAGIVLGITATGDEISLTGSPVDIQEAGAALRTAAASAANPIDRIAALADRLSTMLLSGQTGEQPKRLLLITDMSLTGIPFALLTWPGTKEPLVQQTPITWLPSGPWAAMTAPLNKPREINVLVAAMETSVPNSPLPTLPGASFEPAWIRTALSGRSVVTKTGIQFSRAALKTLIATPGAWVHIASHGAAKNGLESYAGLWLPIPDAGDEVPFFSWLEAADQPARADLIVLDACALASSNPRSIEGAANFATALSAAGAHHVVAALWEVSDSAAAQWVPAFYHRLDAGDSADPAEAVRIAQLRLSASYAFHHPFYWASWVHLQH
jgi:tetratricopeptide (TPR) repeat protein